MAETTAGEAMVTADLEHALDVLLTAITRHDEKPRPARGGVRHEPVPGMSYLDELERQTIVGDPIRHSLRRGPRHRRARVPRDGQHRCDGRRPGTRR